MRKVRWTGRTVICVLAVGLVFWGGPLYGQTGEKIVLTFWHQYVHTSQKAVAKRIIAGFEKENPNIRISTRTLPGMEAEGILRTAFMGGEPPDISIQEAPHDNIKMIERGFILDLTHWYRQYGNRFPKAAESATKYRGRYYSVPVKAAGWLHLFYNVDSLQKYGMTVPKDYDEFLEVCEALRSQGIVPIALGNKMGNTGIHWYQALLSETVGAEQINSILTRKDPDKGPRWTDPGFFRAAKYWDELHEKGYFPLEAATLTGQAMYMMFFSGKRAFMGGGTWFPAIGIPPDFNWGFFRFPHIPGELGYTRNDGCMSYLERLHVSTACRYPEAAVKFLEYWSRPEAARWYFEETGDIPATKGVVKPEEMSEYNKAVMEFVETTTGTFPWMETFLPPAVGFGAIYKGTTSITARTTTPLEFVKNIEKVHQEELRKALGKE